MSDRRPWTPAEEATLRDMRANGETWKACGRALSRSYGSVEKKGVAMGLPPVFSRVTPSSGDVFADLDVSADPVALHRALAEAETRRVQAKADAYDYLRPVHLPPVERKAVRYRPADCWIISSDHHWPHQDERAESLILQAIEALRPKGYILNGDGPDLLALSKYPKDARQGKSWSLREEQVAAKSWWRSVYALGQSWGIQLYETEANHSGNGRASRWRRWLDERAPELHQLDDFEQRNSYQSYFHPSDVPVQMVDEVVIAGDLRVRHGEIVRKHGGYSARAHGDKWQSSVMHGHTHRIGSSIKRRPGIPGVRADEWLRTYETGCVCRLDADYCPGADWAQGFAVVREDPSTGVYGVELVHIIDGVLCTPALGGTLKAA